MSVPMQSMNRPFGRAALAATLLVLLALPASAEEDPWPGLKRDLFADRAIQAEDGTVVLDAPMTADDPALVPVTVRVSPSVTQALKSMTLIIDKNPMPIVATFTFGPAAGTGGERSLSTRVRFDSFSHVRAIVETEDGTLHMTTKFVQAAGGCAAMDAKDPDVQAEGLGKMIVKTFAPALSTAPLWSAQVMLKHPNTNGMQLDPKTGDFIPARFVNEMTVTRGAELVFKMTNGGGSIAANPYFRFSFGRGADNDLDVAITDTKGTVFTGHSSPSGS
jgi:sulfur-oxidizing protein SoxY